ncbi:MAG: matrixin family metalloprotease [Myxococcales bacterium]|nr:matrixin family metalloprotease [Myxococcales bacterium]
MLWIAALTTASAYELRTTDDGQEVRWDAWPVAWDHAPGKSELPDGADDALREAFSTWELQGTPVSFAEGAPPAGVPKRDADGENHVWTVRPWPVEYGSALAMASAWADLEGNLVTFDIQINGEVPWSVTGASGAYDLQAAITHEVGHVLGLEHTEISEAVMFPSTGMGTTDRRDLHADDIHAIEHLYPSFGRGDSEDPNPSSILTGSGCSTDARGGGSAALLVVTTLFLRRRARRSLEAPCSRS